MIRTFAWLCSTALVLGGCAGETGDECSVDSDCGSGLICDFDKTCKTSEAVNAALYPQTPDASAETNGGEACGNDPAAKQALSVQVIETGTGLGAIGSLANPVIASGFDQIVLFYLEGEAGTCPGDCTWFTDPGPGDCGTAYTDTFPFRIPSPIGADFVQIEAYSFDPVTGVLKGRATRDAIVAAISEATQEIVAKTLTPDIDADGDGTLESLSVDLQIGFTAPVEEASE